MIVKITILRLLGSSDDKEKKKIGIARPEEPTHEHRCIQWLSEEPTPWYFGAEGNRSQVRL